MTRVIRWTSPHVTAGVPELRSEKLGGHDKRRHAPGSRARLADGKAVVAQMIGYAV